MQPASERASYKMQPIPPHRAKAIFQEYLDRQAAEKRKKKRQEMAQQVNTWYSDLESEVSEHFDKALQQSAKRARLEECRTSLSPDVPDTSANCNDRSWTSSSTVMGPYSRPLCPLTPLPSLFCPPPIDQPPPVMVYPEYYHYTDEVDPLVSDDYYPPAGTPHEDDDLLFLDYCPTSHTDITCYHSQHHKLAYQSEFLDYPSLLPAASDVVCDTHYCDPLLPAMFADGYHYPLHSVSNAAPQPDFHRQQTSFIFDYTLHTSPATTCEASGEGEDDDIENIQLDWTELERNELQEIMV